MSILKQYIWNILIAFDQLVNAILGGDPDETISSRAAKRSTQFGWYQLSLILETIDPGHMKRAVESDEGKDEIW